MRGPAIASCVAAAAAAGLLLSSPAARAYDPNAIWKIVHDKCVPNQEDHGDPKPCAEVDLKNGVAHGYAVLKDLHGATQYLLIPTQRIVGIESPELLAPDAANYFYDAMTDWLHQHYSGVRTKIKVTAEGMFGTDPSVLKAIREDHADAVIVGVAG